jgi:hypothetical protein
MAEGGSDKLMAAVGIEKLHRGCSTVPVQYNTFFLLFLFIFFSGLECVGMATPLLMSPILIL